MTPLAKRILTTREAVKNWDEQMPFLVGADGDWPAIQMLSRFIASLPANPKLDTNHDAVVQSLLTFALMRIEEATALACLDFDEETGYELDPHWFVNRGQHFDYFCAEWERLGLWYNLHDDPDVKNDWEYASKINKALRLDPIRQAVEAVDNAFAEYNFDATYRRDA